jgi:hypothetical protein
MNSYNHQLILILLKYRRKLLMKFKPLMLGLCLTTSALSQLGMADELPLLGKNGSVNASSLQIDPELSVQFQGGTAFNKRSAVIEVNLKHTDIVDIKGAITLEYPGLVGIPTNVYVYFKLNEDYFIYGKTSTGDLAVVPWNQEIKTLIPLSKMIVEQMPSTLEVPIYQGQLQLPVGKLDVYLGIVYGNFFAHSPKPITIQINNVEPSKLEGEFVAKEDFLPNPDGFGFENYGGFLETDLTDEDMQDFLGKEQACYLSPKGKCILTAVGKLVKKQFISSANGGHCHGMAVASILLKKGKSFKGKDKPADFQSNATTTMELQKSSVRNLIAYYFITQYFETKNKQKPSEVLQTVIDKMNTSDPIATIGIYKRDRTGGHAITPYAVQDKGNGEFWMYVYDNNYPDDASKFIKINRNQETWSYETQINPNAPIDLYDGDATTNNLEAFPLSTYVNFSPLKMGDFAEFQFAGQGLQMLIENWDEQRIGYDFEQEKHVNEIDGAEIIPIFDVGAPPRYRVPITDKEEITGDEMDKFIQQMFGITLGALPGQKFERQADSSLFMRAGQNIAEIGNINLVSGEKFNIAIHPSARMVYLNSESATKQQPEIHLVADDKEKQQSYIYHLSDLKVVAGTDLIIMTSGTDLKIISVAGNEDDPTLTPLDSSTYSLRVTILSADGQRSARSTQLEVPVGVKTRIHVKQWAEESDSSVRSGNSEDGNEGVIEVEIIGK